MDTKDPIGTWIGYRIIDKKPLLRAYQAGVYMEKSVRVSFRLTFVGPHAEDLANQVLLWDDRQDVIDDHKEFVFITKVGVNNGK